jgi:mannose-6-phosphate isomerase-like protein (cupin superfamily)
VSMSRRELCWLLPGAMLPVASTAIAEASAEDKSLPSAGYPFEKLTAQTLASGAQVREVLKGKLATGESIETHETTLPPGVMPHPPHHHVHSEMFLLREGNVELTVNGRSYRLGAGAVGFVHSNEEHSVKNVGSTPATYFVVEMGPGAS